MVNGTKYRIAQVKLSKNDILYSFALFDDDVDIGDRVLCDTQFGYCVGVVEQIVGQGQYYSGHEITKEIICKLDFSNFIKRKENAVRRSELEKQMKILAQENKYIELYRAIAEKNPQMAKLLKEYEEIIDK